MQKINKPEEPDWFKENKTNNKKIVEELLKITNYHCSYTDKKIDKSIAEIDHFKPELKNRILNWENVFVVEPYTNRIKSNRYDDKLLNPSDKEYDFDKYFIIDFENLLLFPNPRAILSDVERAKITIELLGLNNSYLVQDRKSVMEQYLFLYNILKEKTEQDGNVFDPLDFKELDINNYSYRFLLERALTQIFKDKNEYIQEIEIKKYFGIQDFLITDLGNKKEIYFLGENGDGKTLILQSILLALRGLNEKFLYKYLNENLTNDFDIQLTDIYGDKYLYNNLITNINKNAFAYGASRLRHSNQNDIDNNGYLTLFDFNSYLINPIQWLKEIERKDLKKIGNLKLDDAISLLTNLLENRVEIKRTDDGDFVFNERGTKVSFNHLSDGYRSTLIWLCDLISRLSSNQPNIKDLKQYKGIVLVDEIGVFLHPRWEYSIVKKLREIFPNIQWIFTTHSPIIILGASTDAVIYRLYKEDGLTKITKPYEEQLNMTANSLLTSILWRLESFTTIGTQPEFISSDDYQYQKIHQVISKYIQEVPELTDEMVLKMIEEEFEKIRIK